VEGGGRDPGPLAGGDQPRVDRREPGGVDGQFVVQDGAAALAGQVPVDVAGEVDDGGPVGAGLVVDAPVALPGQRVGDPDAQRARIAHLAVGAGQAQVETDVGAPGERLHVPDPLVEALLPAVRAVLAVVDGQLVRPAVQGEAAPVDAVAVAADQGAEVGAGGDVGLQAAEAERDVRVPAAPVRDLQG